MLVVTIITVHNSPQVLTISIWQLHPLIAVMQAAKTKITPKLERDSSSRFRGNGLIIKISVHKKLPLTYLNFASYDLSNNLANLERFNKFLLLLSNWSVEPLSGYHGCRQAEGTASGYVLCILLIA